MTLPLHDKVALITGANAGLGYQLSASFARKGAHVVMACRSPQRAERAREQLLAEVPGAQATLLPLDLSDPTSIQGFGTLLGERVGPIDLVIHNAGVFGVPLARTGQGHEMHFATNYLGPFALTGVLTPHLRDAHGSRMVFVGSLAHRLFKLRIEQLAWAKRYNKWAAYGLSKLALMAFTLELNRRLKKQGSKVIALSAHPGFAPTDGAFAMTAANYKSALSQWFIRTVAPMLPTVATAAAPIVHAATDANVVGGDYYGPSGFLEIAGPVGRARIAAQAHEAQLALDLWSHSESLTGVRFLADTPRKPEPTSAHAS